MSVCTCRIWPSCWAHRTGLTVTGSVCGRGLSGNPVSSIGFERAHNPQLAYSDADAFADALTTDMPPQPAEQKRIVARNRSGDVGAPA